jgi:hypothetical protein
MVSLMLWTYLEIVHGVTYKRKTWSESPARPMHLIQPMRSFTWTYLDLFCA